MNEKRYITSMVLLYMFGVILGCLIMNIVWRYSPAFNLNERKMALSLLENNNAYGMFWEWSIGSLGIIVYLLIISSAFTRLGILLAQGLGFSVGIWCGALCTECIIVKGLSFLVVIGRRMFPEMILYIVAYIFAVFFSYHMIRKIEYRRKQSVKNNWDIWKNFIFSLIFFLLWCFCNFM